MAGIEPGEEKITPLVSDYEIATIMKRMTGKDTEAQKSLCAFLFGVDNVSQIKADSHISPEAQAFLDEAADIGVKKRVYSTAYTNEQEETQALAKRISEAYPENAKLYTNFIERTIQAAEGRAKEAVNAGRGLLLRSAPEAGLVVFAQKADVPADTLDDIGKKTGYDVGDWDHRNKLQESFDAGRRAALRMDVPVTDKAIDEVVAGMMKEQETTAHKVGNKARSVVRGAAATTAVVLALPVVAAASGLGALGGGVVQLVSTPFRGEQRELKALAKQNAGYLASQGRLDIKTLGETKEFLKENKSHAIRNGAMLGGGMTAGLTAVEMFVTDKVLRIGKGSSERREQACAMAMRAGIMEQLEEQNKLVARQAEPVAEQIAGQPKSTLVQAQEAMATAYVAPEDARIPLSEAEVRIKLQAVRDAHGDQQVMVAQFPPEAGGTIVKVQEPITGNVALVACKEPVTDEKKADAYEKYAMICDQLGLQAVELKAFRVVHGVTADGAPDGTAYFEMQGMTGAAAGHAYKAAMEQKRSVASVADLDVPAPSREAVVAQAPVQSDPVISGSPDAASSKGLLSHAMEEILAAKDLTPDQRAQLIASAYMIQQAITQGMNPQKPETEVNLTSEQGMGQDVVKVLQAALEVAKGSPGGASYNLPAKQEPVLVGAAR